MALAAAQSDVLSREQILAHGFGQSPLTRLVAQGRWLRLDNGLFVARDRAPDWLGLAWGGLLIGGDRSRLGGRSAGFLHGLNDEPDPIEVLIPWRTVRVDRGNWQFTRERDGVRAPSSVGNPPRLSLEDTVLDLTAQASEKGVIDIVTRAVQTRRTTPERLLRRLRSRARHPHRRLLLMLLADVAAGAESPLELDFLHQVELAHQLPVGERQQPTSATWQDIKYKQYATVVELDGRLGHAGMGRFRDMRRDNATVVRGDAPLRYGWTDVHCEPCPTAAQLAYVLMARGWPGPFERCPRCQNVSTFEIG